MKMAKQEWEPSRSSYNFSWQMRKGKQLATTEAGKFSQTNPDPQRREKGKLQDKKKKVKGTTLRGDVKREKKKRDRRKRGGRGQS